LFDSIGSQPRQNLAALSTATGVATAWDPGANGPVYALSLADSKIYAGGTFSDIGGQPRHRIAALDASSGSATGWNPDADGVVLALSASGPTLYAGGEFTNIGGQPRSNIAALDTTTGLATAWDPGASSRVEALAANGTTVYAGGHFVSIGGAPRSRVAALDATTGAATAWDPNAYDYLLALAVNGATTYAGGVFTGIGGLTRNRVAALDDAASSLLDWNPNVSGAYPFVFSRVSTIAVSGPKVYIGGDFTAIGGTPHSGIAATAAVPVVDVPVTVDTRPTMVRLDNLPNPFRTSTTIRYALPAAAHVRMEIFDLAGRRAETLLADVWTPAGVREVEFRPAALPSGIYLCRLKVGSEIVTRRMVVID
jgi:hypothetical protein